MANMKIQKIEDENDTSLICQKIPTITFRVHDEP